MTIGLANKMGVYIWYSEPFYTHENGYKLCLGVNLNRSKIVHSGNDLKPGRFQGQNKTQSFISINIFLMWGENDDCLQWPFRGTVIVQLLPTTSAPWQSLWPQVVTLLSVTR